MILGSLASRTRNQSNVTNNVHILEGNAQQEQTSTVAGIDRHCQGFGDRASSIDQSCKELKLELAGRHSISPKNLT